MKKQIKRAICLFLVAALTVTPMNIGKYKNNTVVNADVPDGISESRMNSDTRRIRRRCCYLVFVNCEFALAIRRGVLAFLEKAHRDSPKGLALVVRNGSCDGVSRY